MKRKYKTTGCAKFFLMIVILAPLAYIGASYFNGQDGIENIKNLFGGSDSSKEIVEDRGQDEDLQNEIADLNKEIRNLRRDNDRLKSDLEACQSGKTE